VNLLSKLEISLIERKEFICYFMLPGIKLLC